MPKRYLWALARPQKTPLSLAVKAQVETVCAPVIATLRAKSVSPPDPNFGYTVDVYGSWFRHYYYLVQTVRYDRPEHSGEKDFKFTRLECFENGICNMSFMRHTGQWHEVYQGWTLEKCLEEILSNNIFQPV